MAINAAAVQERSADVLIISLTSSQKIQLLQFVDSNYNTWDISVFDGFISVTVNQFYVVIVFPSLVYHSRLPLFNYLCRSGGITGRRNSWCCALLLLTPRTPPSTPTFQLRSAT